MVSVSFPLRGPLFDDFRKRLVKDTLDRIERNDGWIETLGGPSALYFLAGGYFGMVILERILATPLNHKIHHANQPDYIDRNYSQVFILWDDMFGTRAHYTIDPVVGLIDPVTDNNPLTAQFVGLQSLWKRIKAADRIRDKLAYLWRPPEWAHDGVCRSDCPKYAVRINAGP